MIIKGLTRLQAVSRARSDCRCFVIFNIFILILVALGVMSRMMRLLTVEPPIVMDGKLKAHESELMELLACLESHRISTRMTHDPVSGRGIHLAFSL